MSLRIAARLDDILRAIAEVKALLAGRSRDFLIQDRIARAAFERFLEIISEASRHVPDELKAKHAAIPWQDIASLGNRLRHAYWLLDVELLWAIYADGRLEELEQGDQERHRLLMRRDI